MRETDIFCCTIHYSKTGSKRVRVAVKLVALCYKTVQLLTAGRSASLDHNNSKK